MALGADPRSSSGSDGITPVAIVGVGFRGPKDATNVERFWKLISEGREAWGVVPKEKWNNEAFYHPDSGRNGTSNVKGGHYLTEDLSRFDAPFFNMTNAEAEALDPQQRLLLECSYEALENSGTPLDRAMGSNTSVFVGSFCGDFTDNLMRDPENVPLYQATSSGHSRAIIANRLSYFFDFRGPSVTIDTACSSSLVALHMGCQSIRSGESRQAIVAGANVILSHEMTISMSMMRFLSPDGRCYTFDDRASGYGRGEGVGCLLLKRFDDAVRDGDTIRAVIRNTGVNQDGRTAGITLPNREAQESLIQEVYQKASLDPLDTDFVECHGTGTPAGDPLEAAAISKIFGSNRSSERPLCIGSVKTNVGHLEGASGVAGVIKAILMLENDVILPNRNFHNPNPQIPLQDWKLKVPTAVEEWVAQDHGLHRVSINSFGYGGTNAHAVLESARDFLQAQQIPGKHLKTFSKLTSPTDGKINHAYLANSRLIGFSLGIPSQNGTLDGHASSSSDTLVAHSAGSFVNGHLSGKHHGDTDKRINGYVNGYTDESGLAGVKSTQRVFLLSAFDERSGNVQAQNLSRYLENRLGRADDKFLDDLAYTLGSRRSRLSWKAALRAGSAAELVEKLDDSNLKFKKSMSTPGLAFVFTGQGAQWFAMGRELLKTSKPFLESITKAGRCLNNIGAEWDLKEELSKDESESQVGLAYLSQPLCTAIQLALVDLLATWGIRPIAVTGHSSGEIGAAYTAGALSFEDAIAVAYYRGVVSAEMSSSGKVHGAMIAVGMSKEAARPLLSALKNGKAIVACVNSPSSITISGDTVAINELELIMKEKGVFARKLAVEVAYHSHHMQLVADKYTKTIAHVRPMRSENSVEFFSSVTGRRAEPLDLGPSYWVANMTGEVNFAESLLRLCLEATGGKKRRRRGPASSIQTLVEIGPHSALAGPIKQIIQAESSLSASSIAYQSSLTRKKNAIDTTLDLAASLVGTGYPVDLAACNKLTAVGSYNVLVDLPPYAFNHDTSYWIESRISKAYRNRQHPRNDVLGVQDRSANPLEPRWRNIIRTSDIPWVKDHKVQGNIVYPAAGYLVMAIEAAYQRATDRAVKIRGYTMREITIGQALVVPEHGQDVETVTRLTPYLESVKSPSDLWDEFCILSVTENEQWTEHCRGLICVEKEASVNEVRGEVQLQEDAANMNATITKMELQCKTEINIQDFYEHLRALGLDYGPTFANVHSARTDSNHCISTIVIPDTAATMPSGFQYPIRVHPATADSLLHGLFAALSSESGPLNDPLLPVSVDELKISADLTSKSGSRLNVYTTTERKDARHIKASMIVRDENSTGGVSDISIKGLRCTALSSDAQIQGSNAESNFAYNIEWIDDVDLLSRNDISDLCSDIKPPPEEQSLVRALEQAGFYLMEKCLTTVSRDEASSFLSHHNRLWDCMNTFVPVVRNKQLGIPTDAWITVSETEKTQHIERVSASSAEGSLLCQVGKNLPAILRKEVEALSVMAEGNRLDAYYQDNARFDRNYQAAAKYFRLLGHKNPHLTILEIGAGTGGATLPIMEALGGATEDDFPRFVQFDFTDISSGFFDAAKEKLAPWKDLINWGKLDIENDPLKQGYGAGIYDVVVAANVLHATKSMYQTLSNTRKLLKPGGKLVLIELTRERMTTSTIFGTLPGWWAGETDGRTKGPTLTEEQWDTLLRKSGFSGLEAAVWDSLGEPEHQGSMMVSRAVESKGNDNTFRVALIDHEGSQLTHEPFTRKLTEYGAEVTSHSLTTVNPQSKLCLVLCEMSKPFFRDMSLEQFDSIKRIFTTAEGVLWVTCGALVGPENPDSSLITGFSRTVRSEYGGSKIIALDASPHDLDKTVLANATAHLFKSHFGPESISLNSIDMEYTLKEGRLRIPRIVKDIEFNKAVGLLTNQPKPGLQKFSQRGRPLVIETGTPGLLDSIHFVDDVRISSPLPDDWVEIEVKATGFNFKDVMMAMGQIEVETLGLECSGTITKIGSSVRSHTIGDKVACFAFGAFSNFVRSEAIAVQSLPPDMSFETASALPVTYCTAYYAVYHASRICKGETVLIHAASGGLGQATIELCQLIGAEIFATVGTIEKKKLLMEHYGISEDHIFSSRDAKFAKGIMNMTGNKGVDVIMNSVAGDMLRITWECIAPFGRFVELGARDYTINTRLEMRKFARNVTFTVVNLVSLVRERPKIAAKVWQDVMDLFRAHKLSGPFPLTTYSISEIERALRAMQSGKHMGKLIAVAHADDLVKAIPAPLKMTLLRVDASYLVVGGLSGLGQRLALWMLENGAKNLILTSRRGLSKSGAHAGIELLKSKGANIAVYACDISDSSQLSSVLSESHKMPPIRGVVQGAMVLQDTLLENMTLADYEAVIRPKVQGTWNLHDQLPKDMDFFVMLSSTSGIIGNASQAAYAAASTFLDSFAKYRNNLGFAASTLDLGVISSIGYVAENQELAKNLKRQGFEATSVKVLMAMVQTAMTKSHRPQPRGQIITGLGTWSENSLGAFAAPLFSHFRRMSLQSKRGSEDDFNSASRIREALRDVQTVVEARKLVCEGIIAKVSSLSMIPVEDISELKPITEFGMDSLVAVELRNWLFKELDATMTILELLANNPLSSLALKVTKRSRLVDPAIAAQGGLE